MRRHRACPHTSGNEAQGPTAKEAFRQWHWAWPRISWRPKAEKLSCTCKSAETLLTSSMPYCLYASASPAGFAAEHVRYWVSSVGQ